MGEPLRWMPGWQDPGPGSDARLPAILGGPGHRRDPHRTPRPVAISSLVGGARGGALGEVAGALAHARDALLQGGVRALQRPQDALRGLVDALVEPLDVLRRQPVHLVVLALRRRCSVGAPPARAAARGEFWAVS